MRKGFTSSILFHTMVMVVGYFGLPELRRDLSMVEAPIMVEVVTVAETTNAPALKPKPKPKRRPPPEPPKAPPPPKLPKAEAPPPPAPEPEPEVAAVPPPPEIKPKPKLKAKPQMKPKAKPRPQAPSRLIKARPKRKPKPPDAFASVLKTVKELQRQKPEPNEKSKNEKLFEKQTAKALASLSRRYDTSRPLTISEIDLVRQQIAGCWNLPAGAKDAENLVIEIWVAMNPDGTVRQAKIQQQERMQSGSFFRAAAESALRAVLNKRCQPFKLPRQKYDRWKTMTLVFNPKEMFGA